MLRVISCAGLTFMFLANSCGEEMEHVFVKISKFRYASSGTGNRSRLLGPTQAYKRALRLIKRRAKAEGGKFDADYPEIGWVVVELPPGREEHFSGRFPEDEVIGEHMGHKGGSKGGTMAGSKKMGGSEGFQRPTRTRHGRRHSRLRQVPLDTVPDQIVYGESASSGTAFDEKTWQWQAIHLDPKSQRYQGNKKVVIAVLDGGVDPTNPAFGGNIWSRPYHGQTVHGYNALQGNYQLLDGDDSYLSHGTEVAGVIGCADHFKGSFIRGVCRRVTVVPIKILTRRKGSGGLAPVLAGLHFVYHLVKDLHMNVVATNNSYAFDDPFQPVKDELDLLGRYGVLNVVATGNFDNPPQKKGQKPVPPDTTLKFPAKYHSRTMVVVGAVNPIGFVTHRFEPKLVDLVAPGENVYCLRENPSHPSPSTYGLESGTSIASPFVAGAIGLIHSASHRSGRRIKELLLRTADVKTNTMGIYQGKQFRELNLGRALSALHSTKSTHRRDRHLAQRHSALHKSA